MTSNDHYLTCAAFFLKEKSDRKGHAVVECSAGNTPTLEGQAIIRKLCICGSKVGFDHNKEKWFCINSSKELDIHPWNSEPLLPSDFGEGILESHRNEFSHPEQDSLVVIDGTNYLQVFVKVPSEQLWIIQDPLPILDVLRSKPFQTDLLLNWCLMIGDSSTDDILVDIDLNLIDPFHQRISEILESGQEVGLHFFDTESLSPLGSKTIKPLQSSSKFLKQFRSFFVALPNEPHSRAEIIQGLELAEKFRVDDFFQNFVCLEKYKLFFTFGKECSSPEDFQKLMKITEDHEMQCEKCQSLKKEGRSD